MAVAADVPARFDLVINGEGYMLDRSYDDSPYRKPPAQYAYTSTFLERSNVSNAYGDDAQDFFLTASQNDWVNGEGRRYFRTNDPITSLQYWRGKNVDVLSTPGQASLTTELVQLPDTSLGFAVAADASHTYIADLTHLYIDTETVSTLTKTHGLGASPARFGIVSDGVAVYLSTSVGGTVGIRRYDIAAGTFSTWSTTAADTLAILNNVLYGYSRSTGILSSYGTTGTATTVFDWIGADGTSLTGTAWDSRIVPYGGKLLILRYLSPGPSSELWEYDGANTAQIAGFPSNFNARDIVVVSGITFVGGYIKHKNTLASSNADYQPAIYSYDGATVSLAWRSTSYVGQTIETWPSMAPWNTGFAFTDDTADISNSKGHLMLFDMETSGVSSIGEYPRSAQGAPIASNFYALVFTTQGVPYMTGVNKASSGYITTSLMDFDNSLPKLARGIKVEWETASDGDGGSVDISYQFDSVDGSYTSLQVGAVSGTEYTLPTAQHLSISVRVTINKGTSTVGPILKRIYLRAVPVLQFYRLNTYLIDLAGNKNASPPLYLTLVNGDTHAKDGEEMRADLVTAIAAGPISITDRFGTYTGVIEPANTAFREVGANYGRAQYRAEVSVREI